METRGSESCARKKLLISESSATVTISPYLRMIDTISKIGVRQKLCDISVSD